MAPPAKTGCQGPGARRLGGAGYRTVLSRRPRVAWAASRGQGNALTKKRGVENDADLCDYEVDAEATEKLRADIRAKRRDWARMDPAKVSEMYRKGDINTLDVVRRYATILDWETGEVLEKTTAQFRESYEKRTVAHWA